MWNSIQNGPYQRPMILNPYNTHQPLLEPLSRMTEVDACKNAKELWEIIKRLMFGFDVTNHVRHSRLMDEFDMFAAKEGESLESIYESAIRTTFSCKFFYSPQPYYVTHPSSVVDYDDEYQGKLQRDSQEDKLTTAMMLLARAISQKFSTSTNNRLCISSNTKNQAVVPDGRVNIQTKNAGFVGNANKNTGRQNRNQLFNAGNGSDESNQIIQRIPRTDSTPSKANVQYMKDEAKSNLINEENNFMLDNSYGEENLEGLTAAIMLMARHQPAYDNTKNVPSYDAKAVSEVNASSMVHEQNSECLKKAIAAQPKLYNCDSLHNVNLIIDSPDSEETLEDVEEIRLKMRNKMVKINYEKLNTFYEAFVRQQEFFAEQTYFLIPFTSNNGSESKDVPSNNLKEIKEELIKEVQEVLNIFESMEQKVNEKSLTEILIQNEIDRLLEVSLPSEIRDCVLLSVEKKKIELLKAELEKSSSDSKDIQANLLKRIKILENDFKRS
ncbi:hypothetical protein Tco_0722557 [Tanacetum coccineum]